jgi:hypothetical protein
MVRSTNIRQLDPSSIMRVSLPDAKSKVAYLSYAALEIAGMALILWDGLPIYRHLFVMKHVGTNEDRAIFLIAVIAIQAGYWRTFGQIPPFEIPKQTFLGHVLLFMSRLAFIFASSLFALVFYRAPNLLDFHPVNLLLFVAILFSVFCFTRHLEAMGNLLLTGSKHSKA